MVTKVEHLGSTPTCQPQKIKEITLQVKGERESEYRPDIFILSVWSGAATSPALSTQLDVSLYHGMQM